MRHPPGLRWVAAVLLNAAAGAVGLAALEAAIEWASAPPGMVVPSESVYLVLAFAFFLSLPVVALALPSARLAAVRLALAGDRRRTAITFAIGVGTGMAVATALTGLFIMPGLKPWHGLASGLLWGGAASIIGPWLIPTPAQSGVEHA